MSNNPLLDMFEEVKNKDGAPAPKTTTPVAPTAPAPVVIKKEVAEAPVAPVTMGGPPLTIKEAPVIETPVSTMPLENKGGGVFGSLRDENKPTGPKFTPSGVTNSDYRIQFPDGLTTTPQMVALRSKRVEDMSQEELREIYLYIKGKPGSHIYSASDLNYAATTGRLPGERDHEETDSLFIGDQVHKAMELKGSNLQKLKYKEEIGPPPAAPVFPDFTKATYVALEDIAKGGSLLTGVKAAYNNKVTKAVTVEQIKEAEALLAADPEASVGKDIVALFREAKKQLKQVTENHVKSWQQHLQNVADYEKKASLYFKEGDIILDSSVRGFGSMSGERMKNTILNTYKSLCENAAVMDVYDGGVGSHGGTVLTEYVVLWEHNVDGKVVKCKSMFDRYIINPEQKKVTVSDIKTHSGRSTGFVSGNYHNYGYYRSMSFYKEAVMYDLRQRGYDPSDWDIKMVLLPASTMYVDLGCHFPTAIISDIDLQSGRFNGVMKPYGVCKYSEADEVQIFCNAEEFEIYKKNKLLIGKCVEYKREGWETVMTKLIKSVI